MSLVAFALVPSFANLLEDNDCPYDGEQEQDGMTRIVFDIHLLCLQLLQVVRMLPTGARLRTAAKDFAVSLAIAAAVYLTGILVIAAGSVTRAAYQGDKYGCKGNEPHGSEYILW